MWKCCCDCGNETIVNTSNLKNGSTKSCGCWKYSKIKEHNTKHGGVHDRLYNIWKNMKRRCNNSNDKHYETYGGKGIKVCEEWSNSYQSFKEWAYKNGYDDSAEFQKCTLDRIDNDGNYEPSNCRWVTMKEQNLNKRSNAFIEFMGIRKPRSVWADAIGIHSTSLKYRVEKWGIEKALLTDKDGNYIDPAELLKKMREE